jgi:hypothetical protein
MRRPAQILQEQINGVLPVEATTARGLVVVPPRSVRAHQVAARRFARPVPSSERPAVSDAHPFLRSAHHSGSHKANALWILVWVRVLTQTQQLQRASVSNLTPARGPVLKQRKARLARRSYACALPLGSRACSSSSSMAEALQVPPASHANVRLRQRRHAKQRRHVSGARVLQYLYAGRRCGLYHVWRARHLSRSVVQPWCRSAK